MQWSCGSDIMAKHFITANTLAAAMEYCTAHGLGYDILLPRHKYHARKAYAENFKWKGEYVEPEQED